MILAMKRTLFMMIAMFTAIASVAQTESDIVITEIMYNQPGDDSLEFIELYNAGAQAINLEGYKFTSGITHTFSSLVLNPGSYLVISKYPAFTNAFYGISSIGWTEGSLDNGGEKIVLKTPEGLIADSVDYEDGGPWSKDADGEGPSLILCNPKSDNSLGYNWRASGTFIGIFPPGSSNFIFGTPELPNTCTAPGDIFPPRTRKAYAESATSVIVKFDEPVQISSSQVNANYTGLGPVTSAVRIALDSVRLTLSTPLTLGQFYTLSVSNVADTTGNYMTSVKTETVVFNNTVADLVITEIFYDNAGNDTLEFIELMNNGSEPAILGGYAFTDGIDFTFPSMTLAPGEFVVVVQHPVVFNSFFGTNVNFQFIGSLNNEGEKVTLKNTVNNVIDSMTYQKSWQPLPEGASLTLCDPDLDNRFSSNWGASANYKGDFLGKSVWASPFELEEICIPLSTSKKHTKSDNISVYPNPTTGAFVLSAGSFQNTKNIEVLNTLGTVVYTTSSSDSKVMLDLRTVLKKGIYYIRITGHSNDATEMVKLIVE